MESLNNTLNGVKLCYLLFNIIYFYLNSDYNNYFKNVISNDLHFLDKKLILFHLKTFEINDYFLNCFRYNMHDKDDLFFRVKA